MPLDRVMYVIQAAQIQGLVHAVGSRDKGWLKAACNSDPNSKQNVGIAGCFAAEPQKKVVSASYVEMVDLTGRQKSIGMITMLKIRNCMLLRT